MSDNLGTNSAKEKVEIYLCITSPVHIGTREGKLTALDFVHLEGRTHIIKEDAFGRFLASKGDMVVDQFVRHVGSGSFIGMADFLSKLQRLDFKKATREISSSAINGGASNMKEFRPFIRDGANQVYIPGSSLKGVLRTTLLYQILANDPEAKKRIEQKAEDGLRKIRQDRRLRPFYSLKWLQESLLADYDMRGTDQAPHKDLLRCLSLRDAYPVGTVKTRIIPLQFLSKNGGGIFSWSGKRRRDRDAGGTLEIWVEAAVEGIFRVELLWDQNLLSKFREENSHRSLPVAGCAEILNSAHNMNARLVEHEIDFLSHVAGGHEDAPVAAKALHSWYKGLTGNLIRIGFGSGMLGTTVNHLFKEKLRQEIRDICGDERPNAPAPKSRRIWRQAEAQWLPLGWLTVCQAGEKPAVILKDFVEPPKSIERAITPKPRQPLPPPVAPTSTDLLLHVKSINIQDKLTLDRFLSALENLEDEEECRQIARILSGRMKAASIWQKHAFQKRIEMLL